MKKAQLKDRALRLHSEGKTVAEIAKRCGASASTVKRWLADPGSSAPSSSSSGPKLGLVHDADPSDVLERPGAVDAEAHELARELELADELGANAPGQEHVGALTPQAIVTVLESVLVIGVQFAARAKKVELTPDLVAELKLTPSERAELEATAPFVLPYVNSAVANTPAVGVGFFLLSCSSVVLSRVDRLSSVSRSKAQPPKSKNFDERDDPSPAVVPEAKPELVLVPDKLERIPNDLRAVLGEPGS